MNTRLIITITAAWLYLSCTSTVSKKESVVQQLTAYDKAIAEKQAAKDTAAMIVLSGKKTELLLGQPDSLRAYIHLNAALYDSGIQWKNKKFASACYDNIICQAKAVEKDTTLAGYLLNAYFWRGRELFFYGYNDSAVNYLENFVTLSKKFDKIDSVRQGKIYCFLGIEYNILGDMKRSLFCYNQATAIYQQLHDNDNYASNISNALIALNEAGQYDSVIAVTGNTLLLDKIKPKRIALLYAYLATAQINKGLIKESYISINKACAIIDTFTVKDGDLWEKQADIYSARAQVELIAGDTVAGETSLRKALQYIRIKNKEKFRVRDIGKRLIALGYLQLNSNIDSALSYYQQALYTVTAVDSANIFSLPSEAAIYSENTIMEALDGKAAALEKKYSQAPDIKYFKAAVSAYLLSFETERKLMQDFSYDESKLTMLQVSRKRSEKAIDLCWKLQQLTQDNYWGEQAFVFAEKSKAFVLLESIKKNIASNSILQNDTSYNKMQELQLQLAYFARTIIENTQPGKDSILKVLRIQKEQIEDQLLTASKALQQNNTAYNTALEKADNISVAGIKNELLDDKTILTEFFYGDSSVYIFSFSKKDKVQFFKAAPGIETKINIFRHFFIDRDQVTENPAAFQKAGYDVYTGLGFSAANTTAYNRLIIIPDGRLSIFPFDALVTAVQPVQELKRFNYLIAQQELSYGYSANTLLKKLQESNNSISNIVGFAPVFENGQRGRQPLLSSSEEVKAIKEEWKNGQYFFGKEANLAGFRKMAASANIIHIATHANADTSAIAVPGIDLYDSTLYLDELYALKLPASLVVLSACETGIGHIEKSEGPMSLARGFYYAGAKNIITSLWNVDDVSTTQLFKSFYSNINSNDFAASLRSAKMEYIKHASISGASPYYWAGFIEIGYERHATKSSHMLWWVITITILFFVTSLLFLRKKRMTQPDHPVKS
jgi:hypothetical protein